MKKNKNKLLFKIIPALGASLEWFEFSLFAFLIPVLSKVFFPNHSDLKSLTYIFILFATGYISRPIGGIIFGYIGDKYGRTHSLKISTQIMALSMILFAILPTYSRIGIYAIYGIFIIRFIQGISLGGEYTSVLVILLEKSLIKNRATLTSSAEIFSGIGTLISAITVSVIYSTMPKGALQEYGWRIAYIIGFCLALLTLYLQSFCTESTEFIQSKKKDKIKNNSIKLIFKNYKKEILIVAIFTGFLAIPYYLAMTFLPNYLIKIHEIPKEKVMTMIGIITCCYLVCVPISATISDKTNKRKPIMIITTIFFIIIAIPVSQLIRTHNLLEIYIGIFLLLITYGFQVAVFSSVINEIFPIECRLTGVSLGYNLGICLLGGTVPLINSYLIQITGIPEMPYWYMMAFAILNLILLFYIPETHPKYFTAKNKHSIMPN